MVWTEISFVDWLKKRAMVQGVGDDAAVLTGRGKHCELVTLDALVEGVHFDFRWGSWRDVGWKALAVNVSDIAAMGGKPTYCFLALGLPKATSHAQLREFFHGFQACAKHYGVILAGGDTVYAPQVNVQVTLLGTVAKKRLRRRQGAKPGDAICVSRLLGGAAAGLFLLQQGKQKPARFVQEQLRPVPEVARGEWLGRSVAVTAMTDASDGLARAAFEIARASKVAIHLEEAALPFSPQLLKIAPFRSAALQWALQGGEEYCLVFTVRPDHLVSLQRQFKRRFGEPCFMVGQVKKGKGIFLHQENNKTMELERWGYDAFQ